jgi:hypothetical protein
MVAKDTKLKALRAVRTSLDRIVVWKFHTRAHATRMKNSTFLPDQCENRLGGSPFSFHNGKILQQRCALTGMNQRWRVPNG